MNIDIKGTNIELTEAIRQYVIDKLQALNKVIRDTEGAYIHAEVGKDSQHHQKGEVFRAEVKVSADGNTSYAVVMKDDLYAAIDQVKDEIVEKVKSHKDKQHSLIRRRAREFKDYIRGFWQKK